jgi:hypothetical protein
MGPEFRAENKTGNNLRAFLSVVYVGSRDYSHAFLCSTIVDQEL